jgi:ABC-2 type transport system permease protein
MTTTTAATVRASDRPGIRSRFAREANATFAIAWREVLRAIKSPSSIAFTVIFPVIFMGVLGGSISQNLGGALPYAYLPFMLIGMVANTLYQGTIVGVTNLVEERENDFTAELFVAPISRYAVLLGKIVGSGIASLISLVGIIAMIFVMQIPMSFGDLLRVIALAPILALAGGSLGVFFIGFVQDPKTAGARGAARVPADLPVGGADPDRGLDRDPRRPRAPDADDLQHRPGPEHLLRRQAGGRLHGPQQPVARSGGDRRLLPGLHDRRHVHVRPRRPQPLRFGPWPGSARRPLIHRQDHE